MESRKTIRKWFWVWEFEKEEDWLNEMAMNGWVLENVGWCTYHFVRCEPGYLAFCNSMLVLYCSLLSTEI